MPVAHAHPVDEFYLLLTVAYPIAKTPRCHQLGRSLQRVRRVDGRWKFQTRKFHFFHAVPLSQGWADTAPTSEVVGTAMKRKRRPSNKRQ